MLEAFFIYVSQKTRTSAVTISNSHYFAIPAPCNKSREEKKVLKSER